MEKRNVTVTLDKAREWYNSGNTSLKEIALQAFSKEELTVFDFTRIKTFEDALTALEYTESAKVYIRNTINDISMYSKASAAMAQLNIVRKALNLGQGLSLIKDPRDSDIYYPCNPFVTKNSTYYKKELSSGKMEVIGKFKSKGEEYDVLNSNFACSGIGVSYTDANFGLLGCVSEEIAVYFGKHFGMLITEAKYGDLKDFVIIKKEYEN